MATVYSRISISDFNIEKFGTTLNLSEKANNFLDLAEPIPDWTKTELESGTLAKTDFYTNPVLIVSNQIKTNVETIVQTCAVPATDFPQAIAETTALVEECNLFLDEIDYFIEHTERISGRSDPAIGKPDYVSCVGVGGIALSVVSRTDGVRDSSPILGNFTSLFISDDLQANNFSIGTYSDFLTESVLEATLAATEENPYAGTQVSGTEINLIRGVISNANTLIYTRRTSDENHFEACAQLAKDYNFLVSISNAGSTQKNMINDLIGTDKLKNIVNS